MGIFSIISGFFKALGIILGLIERKQERDIGAELQRGRDSADELTRITKSVNARLDPTVPVGVRDPFDDDGTDSSGNKDTTRL